MQFWLAQICIDQMQLHAVALRSPALECWMWPLALLSELPLYFAFTGIV